ncbi:MAG: hypothetical protein K6A94_01730 [Bacteroidales bacterium]|nr:hypothetical protein [Bacteroidales bacterium]
MKKEKPMGLLLNGSVRSAGVTFYLKQGQMIVRSSKTVAKRSNTHGQFVQRQRMRHTTALWQQMKGCHPMFDGGKSTYARFATLANRLPEVFVPCKGPLEGASFLMPDMPVSDGNLTPIKQHLGSVVGSAALLTDLTTSDIQRYEKLLLYTAEQRIEGSTPRVRFQRVREVAKDEFTEVDGHLALTGEEFADTLRGWALVRVRPSSTPGAERCSTQSLVTHCRLYEQYTTEEALQKAAESYGGLTERL